MTLARFTKLFLMVAVVAFGCSGPAEPIADEDAKKDTTVETSECGESLNPMCEPNSCLLDSGAIGLCRLDSELNCVCDEKEVVTKDPCFLLNNPKCEPKSCITNDQHYGQCTKYQDEFCYCAPEEPHIDPDFNPCGGDLNPMCEANPCKMNADEDGICMLNADNYCHCVKDEEPNKDPCGEELNPTCEETACKLVGGTAGSCKMAGDQCVCEQLVEEVQDPCGEELNPTCEETACELDGGGTGLCTQTGGSCTCSAEIPDTNPCGITLNPQCSPVDCLHEEGGEGTCESDGVSCFCVRKSNCGDYFNPLCAPIRCQTENGYGGRCIPHVSGDCFCKDAIVIPIGQCSVLNNPMCTNEPCETADGRPGLCGRRGPACVCLENGHAKACCDSDINPTCDPRGCETVFGLKGKCISQTCATGDICLCLASPSSCTTELDCLDLEWREECNGRWICQSNVCTARCDADCGDQKCEPLLGESKLSCPADCDAYCFKNEDCDDTQYCKFTEAPCQLPGKCEAKRVNECGTPDDRVCGCDGITYDSSCHAEMAGMSIRHSGVCEAPRG
ncbi:MAG TPA: hypothetical protein PLS96_08430 [Myxococcota bacterium]|nr:hypothetical protein [Myxococcota bacterium]HQI60987.1 hypothetical protein [Myxococcota bacterium]